MRGRYNRTKYFLKKQGKRFWSFIGPVAPAVLIAGLIYRHLYQTAPEFPFLDELEKGKHLAIWGAFYDLVVAAIVLVLFDNFRRKREQIERYIEEIDDFKKWDTPEARVRIAGHLRRLAKLGRTDIDCSGIILRNFSFPRQDIRSIRGAVFNSGLWLENESRNSTVFEEVDFTLVDCRKVRFSATTFDGAGLGMTGKNLGFYGANLTDARFDGAKIIWTKAVADEADWYQNDESEDGQPISMRIYEPAFSGANLTRCSFRYADLQHADFREANHIDEADFTGAKGLDTCYFDDGVYEEIVKRLNA